MNPVRKAIESDKHTLNKLSRQADKIMALADEMGALSDEQLQNKTLDFKTQLSDGKMLDDILVPAFAVVREAAKRVLGLYPFKVQVMGGIVLHGGNIAEMKTGEGKTLTATMPVYLNALSGKGVHVITVNEYLSRRDAEEMGELYNWLGLSVGLSVSNMDAEAKKAAYDCDITYSTNSEIGFDYLRDNMASSVMAQSQRGLNFALIDEVDSALIDEARTPLIISGPDSGSNKLYLLADHLVKELKPEHYDIDWESKTISLTDSGIDFMEQQLGKDNLYADGNSTINHYLEEALQANYLMANEKDYIVRDGEVLIVDSFTGRVMDGRRFNAGLHQALEAKEGVTVQPENKTVANITYQNLFRMYHKLSGMTGTAKTEADEFREIYNMDVVAIPTNKPIARVDEDDVVYPTLDAKFKAVIDKIVDLHKKGQPILVGTVSVETSDYLSKLLDERGIEHAVLNAKNNATEAEIIMNAGQKGAVTIATNMAGRGTDIKLGPGVVELGGLAVIGTERHESRRIDNQLRGRAGRQGDPGLSQFYLSLEDDLMLRFGGERIGNLLAKLQVADDDAVITSKFITRQIESAQKRVEGNNYDTRKNVLQYDDVLRAQREVMYHDRQEIISEEKTLKPQLFDLFKRVITNGVHACGTRHLDYDMVVDFYNETLGFEGELVVDDIKGKKAKDVINYLMKYAEARWEAQAKAIDDQPTMLAFEKNVMTELLDKYWMDHIDAMDQLRQSVGLRGYGQMNPLVAYEQEGYQMYQNMLNAMSREITSYILQSSIEKNIENA